jgi:hypothetical protein
MANKKISELESRASLSLSDLMAVGDPSTGYLYKTTISDLKTLTGAGVVSFNGRFGTVNPAEGDYTLTQLGDVIITSATNGQVLQYNGSNWVNSSLNLTTTLAALTDVTISSIANNQLLRYNSTSQKWENWTPNYLTAESDTLNSVTGRGNTTANSITVGSVTAAGLSNLLGEIRTFATTGNIYMGANPGSATDAGFRLDVLGTTRLNGNTTVTGVLTGSDTIRSTNGTVTVSLSYGSTAGIIGTTSNHSLELRTNNTYRVGVSTAGVVNIANLTGTGSRMVVADAAGNLSTQAIPTSAVSSVFGRTGAVVAANGDYTTSQVTEGTNLYYTDARARAAITLTTTGSSGAATYSGGTLNIPTYTLAGLGGQPALSGTGFVKISGTTISYDNSTYLTTSSAASTYLPLAGGTLTGALNGTSASFTGNIITTGASAEIMANGSGSSNTVGGSSRFTILDSSNNRGWIIQQNASYNLSFWHNNSGWSNVINFAPTGAATFSSSVQTTGLLVGTGSSAGYLARIYGGNGSQLLLDTTSQYCGVDIANSGSIKGGLSLDNTNANFGLYTNGSIPLTFQTNNIERMRINSGYSITYTSNNAASATFDLNYKFTVTNDSARIRFQTTTSHNLNEPGEISFWTRANDAQGGGSIAERARITSNGNFGIGTTSILGSSTEKTIHLAAPTNQYATFYLTNSANTLKGIFALADTTSKIFIGSQSNHDFGIITNDTERLKITSGGMVGINTTSPGSSLPSGAGWTSQPTKARVLQINSTDGNANSGVFLRQADNSTGLDLWSDNYYGDAYFDSRWDNPVGKIYFRLRTSNTPLIAMTMTAAGNVGINTTNPTSTLDVTGTGRFYSNSSSAGNATGLKIEQAGAGDAAISYLLSGVREWLVGVDNSDGDTFKINNITGSSDFNNVGFSLATTGAATFSGDVKVKTLEITNVGTDATSSGVSTYMRITVNGQNYLIPLHGTP